MIWIKGADQSETFQTFDCPSKSLPILYYHRLISAKKVQGSYVL